MKFDCIVSNPPYQVPQKAKGKRGSGNILWDEFVFLSLDLIKEGGYIGMIHPTSWRKPQSKRSKSNRIQDVLFKSNMIYLEMHSLNDGLRHFKSKTRYDMYILQKSLKSGSTLVQDENKNKFELDIEKYPFIPNFNLDLMDKVLAKEDEEKCEIMFSTSKYETRTRWMCETESKEFCYPCIHAINKDGIKFWYSKRNDRGYFGVPKVIISETNWINDVLIDFKGEYGMTQGVMGLKISSLEEGEKIRDFLLSDKGRDLIDSCSWGTYRIDWRMFKFMRRDFWRHL